MAFRFDDLQVWQKALDVDDQINTLTKQFPKDELFILTSQIKRAADSVVLNIAEESAGQTKTVLKLFFKICYEVVSGLFIAPKKKLYTRRAIQYLVYRIRNARENDKRPKKFILMAHKHIVFSTMSRGFCYQL